MNRKREPSPGVWKRFWSCFSSLPCCCWSGSDTESEVVQTTSRFPPPSKEDMLRYYEEYRKTYHSNPWCDYWWMAKSVEDVRVEAPPAEPAEPAVPEKTEEIEVPGELAKLSILADPTDTANLEALADLTESEEEDSEENLETVELS